MENEFIPLGQNILIQETKDVVEMQHQNSNAILNTEKKPGIETESSWISSNWIILALIAAVCFSMANLMIS